MVHRKGFTFIVSGPSGAGKSSLCRGILSEDSGVGMCITTTTRPRRTEEEECRDRYFLSEEEFREGMAAGAFAEWANVHGYLYGTTWDALHAAQRDHDVVLLDVDVQGAAHWRRQLGEDCVTVFVAPPTMKALKARLASRGANSPEDLRRRIQNAMEEMAHAGEYDFLVVNDRFEEALQSLRSILEAERRRGFRQAPDLIEEILHTED